ncbi:aggrecan core protein-like isoform X2 [Stegastes partitus]|uniref:Aggrecan core protein-like isoform X2 n=1 Tax=Stegastes partitus TaxID=144197 RepID=A0A9Y4NU37_9TELE|nr:PREDICTED: aggrecan core protein-like isoform X2 [Stegastes partitus]
MSSSSAQKYCRENFIDLATVRNEIQNQQLQSLDSNWAWIGLFRDPNFYWSDGSSFSFSHFDDVDNQNGSERVMCGVSSPHRAGRWRFLDCNIRIPFVCYSIPVKKQVVKLRIKLDDSSVDPNDPAVKAELLKKLQDRLKEKGVSGVTLKWREQPDGKVCHKEVPQRTTPAC